MQLPSQMPGVVAPDRALRLAGPGHAPLLGQLAEPGQVRIRGAEGGALVYDVTGGFISVTGEGVTVLAESCSPASA